MRSAVPLWRQQQREICAWRGMVAVQTGWKEKKEGSECLLNSSLLNSPRTDSNWNSSVAPANATRVPWQPPARHDVADRPDSGDSWRSMHNGVWRLRHAGCR